jgi:hypothetical protein
MPCLITRTTLLVMNGNTVHVKIVYPYEDGTVKEAIFTVSSLLLDSKCYKMFDIVLDAVRMYLQNDCFGFRKIRSVWIRD